LENDTNESARQVEMIDFAIGAIAAKQASKAKTVTQESKKGLRCDNRCGPGGPGSRLNERSMSRGLSIGEQSVLAAKLAHKAKDRAKKNRKGLQFDSSCGYGGPRWSCHELFVEPVNQKHR
jgi:hypothetical protein